MLIYEKNGLLYFGSNMYGDAGGNTVSKLVCYSQHMHLVEPNACVDCIIPDFIPGEGKQQSHYYYFTQI